MVSNLFSFYFHTICLYCCVFILSFSDTDLLATLTNDLRTDVQAQEQEASLIIFNVPPDRCFEHFHLRIIISLQIEKLKCTQTVLTRNRKFLLRGLQK